MNGRSVPWTWPCHECRGTGRVPDVPGQAFADTNGVPPGDEWAGELEHVRDDAAVDVVEALAEAREVAEYGGVELWREAALDIDREPASPARLADVEQQAADPAFQRHALEALRDTPTHFLRA